jgi:hypothetical protein
MMLKTAAPAGVARGLGSSRLSAFTRSTQQQQRRVVVRFKTDDPDVYQKTAIPDKTKDTKLSEEQLKEVCIAGPAAAAAAEAQHTSVQIQHLLTHCCVTCRCDHVAATVHSIKLSYMLHCCPASVLQVYNKEEGNVSPHMAELRADMGKAATDLTTMQTFDGMHSICLPSSHRLGLTITRVQPAMHCSLFKVAPY